MKSKHFSCVALFPASRKMPGPKHSGGQGELQDDGLWTEVGAGAFPYPRVKARANLLPWWKDLTEGFKKARIVVQKVQKKIEDVKHWAAKSLAPILAVLAASPDAGDEWIQKMIITGPDRWKQKHYDLLAMQPKRTYVLKARA